MVGGASVRSAMAASGPETSATEASLALAAAAAAAAADEDDSWLYGEESRDRPPDDAPADDVDGNAGAPPPQADGFDDTIREENETRNDDSHFNDEHFEDGSQQDDDGNGDSQENGATDSDDSEDDVKVILGDIKTLPQTYPSLNIKRGGLIAQTGIEKQKHTGKFSIDDFEAVGTINGVPAQDFNIDVLEDKPWRKPGADLTDYFNYGFNEETWRAYCDRQKRMRIHESGSGLIPLSGSSITGMQQPRHPTPILNDNSKYSVGFTGIRKAGPPPGRKLTGPIDVIGGRRDGHDPENPDPQTKIPMQIPVRENTIQVMTADRREYSRNKPFPDLSLPPPGALPPSGDFFHSRSEQQFYPPPYHQEDNWGNKSGWAPSDIKELTPGHINSMGQSMGMPPGPGMGPPPNLSHPPVMNPSTSGPPPNYQHMHMRHQDMDIRDRDHMMHRERDKDGDEMRDKDDLDSLDPRDRNRDRSRSSKPDRREKNHRRDRSRSRSRRHKSRSRSPSSRHRSKKKSHRKEKDDSD